MRPEIRVHSIVPLDVFCARLDARGREWRESRLPVGLRQASFLRVDVRRTGHSFEIAPHGGDRRLYVPRLVGRARATPDGGTEVEAEFRAARTTVWNYALGALLPLAIVAVSREVFPALWLGAALLLGASVGHALAEPVRGGLEEILRDAAETPRVTPEASPPAPST